VNKYKKHLLIIIILMKRYLLITSVNFNSLLIFANIFLVYILTYIRRYTISYYIISIYSS